MLSILLVDDEALARDRLARMINRFSDYQVVGEAANGEQAVQSCLDKQPDIVLMDIRMPGMDGMAAARELSTLAQAPALIFCTAYGEYALDAFDVNAVGYLLKPVNKEKLLSALQGAKRLSRAQIQALDISASEPETPERQYLSANFQSAVKLIAINSIAVLNADQKYVTAYHDQGEALIEESLKSLEDEFSNSFVRVHRNALVAINRLESLQRQDDGSYTVCLRDCALKPQVSRRHVAALKKMMQSL